MFQKIQRTLRFVCLTGTLVAIFTSISASAEDPLTITNDFSSDPLLKGWEIFGDTNLFTWESNNENLHVTWDSSKTNSYFRLPLGMVATSEDSFAVTLSLFLNDIQIGVRPENPGTFQIAFGFQNRTHADRPNFIRGTGADTPNLVEFNFLPDSGFGGTVWPTIFPDERPAELQWPR